MLSFLDQHRHKNERKSTFKFMPAMVYGHTHESLPHMLNRHTVYYQSKHHKLPELKIQSKGEHFHQLKEEFHVSTQFKPSKSRHQQRKSVDNTGPAFNLIKGEFTHFLDKHKHYKSIGELHKEPSKIQKKSDLLFSNWNTSTNVQSKNMASDYKNKLSLDSSKKSSSILASIPNSSLLFNRSASVSILQKPIAKTKIRQRRYEFMEVARKQLQLRRCSNAAPFGLPRGGPDHELYFVNRPKIQPIMCLSDDDQMNKQLEIFQKRLQFKAM